MKIDPTVKTVAPSPVAEERTRTQKQATEKPAGEPGASVQLSSLSAHLQEIEAGLDSEKAVDSKRVAEIKRSIADGKFEVNADKVADRLIEGTREFLRAHKQ
jgi:negative regulator of flagellin synthesis FlgM